MLNEQGVTEEETSLAADAGSFLRSRLTLGPSGQEEDRGRLMEACNELHRR